MYSWDRLSGQADEPAETTQSGNGARSANGTPTGAQADPADEAARAAQAVQVALDRRDNGGDTGPGWHR
jgi:hypothetical protein